MSVWINDKFWNIISFSLFLGSNFCISLYLGSFMFGRYDCAFGNIPTKLLKEVPHICAPPLNDIWNNEIITQKCFSNNLKLADVTPVFKKEDASLLKNYRPVSVLPVVSEIYERIMQKQILE